METKSVTAVLVVDLSAASDMVHHDVLQNVMRHRFGIKNTCLRWIDSYLRPRSFNVCVENKCSSVRDTEFLKEVVAALCLTVFMPAQ